MESRKIETYAPGVQWTMIILMLTLDMFLGLKSKEGYVKYDLLHANIGESENFYINMPKAFDNYFKTGCKKCLKFKKTFCGLC